MTAQEAIKYMRMYKGEDVDGKHYLRHAFDLSDEVVDMAIQSLESSCSVPPLSETDLLELEHRFGEWVRFVVEDMLTGKGERWEMRLIDADALDEWLKDAEIDAKKNRKYVFASAINTIRGNLMNVPTIEPEPYKGDES